MLRWAALGSPSGVAAVLAVLLLPGVAPASEPIWSVPIVLVAPLPVGAPCWYPVWFAVQPLMVVIVEEEPAEAVRRRREAMIASWAERMVERERGRAARPRAGSRKGKGPLEP